jgi:hypothetical protein
MIMARYVAARRGFGQRRAAMAAPVELCFFWQKSVPRLIRIAGATRFFWPRYSPDRNPIERVCAKLKTRRRQTDPRTTEAIWRGRGDLLGHFIPAESAITSQRRLCLSPTGSL